MQTYCMDNELTHEELVIVVSRHITPCQLNNTFLDFARGFEKTWRAQEAVHMIREKSDQRPDQDQRLQPFFVDTFYYYNSCLSMKVMSVYFCGSDDLLILYICSHLQILGMYCMYRDGQLLG